MSKQVLFIANSLDNAFKFQSVLSTLDVGVSAGSTQQVRRLLAPGSDVDLVIFEAREKTFVHLQEVISLSESRGSALLVITDEACVGELLLPAGFPCDFIMHDAQQSECLVRIRRLLGENDKNGQAKTITIEDMTMNLATYQVTVAGQPVDFTYLEYALLAFLVQHPDRTFSRDVLLQNVWGFDSYCGSRTVDVHVRRIRAKLGPGLAEHIGTVRGVGYHWSSLP